MPEFLTPKQVAERYAVSAETVAGWIRGGELPAICISSRTSTLRPRFRVARDDLERFESARRVLPPGPRRRRHPAYQPKFIQRT